ncbi:vanadium-dependent haloperoxidase [soil metagenome]
MRRSVLSACAVAVALVCAACASSDTEARGLPAEPEAGRWRPWVLPSADAVAVDPPPEDDSALATRERARLERMAAGRDREAAESIRLWSDYPAIEPWINLSLDLVAEEGVKDPPRAARAYALLSVAVYDAMVSTWHWKYVYDRAPPTGVDAVGGSASEPSYPSEHAAMAGAAARVLPYVFPELPALRFDALAREAARSRVVAGANYPSDVEAGLDLGRAVADEVIARAEGDGYGRRRGSRGIPRGRRFWKPPPGSVALPVEPLAGEWRPWVIGSHEELLPPPPPEYGSPEFLAEAAEVMRVGNHLTARQERIVKYWAAGPGTSLPPGMWNELALDQVQESRLSIPAMARVFALLNVAEADAAIAAWRSKYTYWSPRPVNAIRALGLDPRWSPYLPTPLFPAYVSGHSAFSAAAAEVLGYLWPEDASRFRAMAQEAGISRIYGGIHYPSDNEEGLRLGRRIGRMVVAGARGDGASN